METLLMLLPVILFVVAWVVEAVAPGREMPEVPRWRAKGVLFFVLSGAISTVVPFAYAGFFAEHRLFDLTGLGIIGGTLVGFLVTQLAAYWWHRTLHRVHWLWRWTHQMHHSAERLDISGAFYFHPFDIAAFTVVTTGVPMALGVAPEAAALVGVIGLVYAIVQHTNVRTPRWLGYVIQRPESHAVHHERGVHAYNYADLPLWDMVFGTFRNPVTFTGQNGFWDGASRRVGAMLVGRDVAPGA
jgi:sterol desaturase/sphingolipid hydroxylase (fatty acid hydroxylase superfamily)